MREKEYQPAQLVILGEQGGRWGAAVRLVVVIWLGFKVVG